MTLLFQIGGGDCYLIGDLLLLLRPSSSACCQVGDRTKQKPTTGERHPTHLVEASHSEEVQDDGQTW